MIDFANATEFDDSQEPDHEYLCGLENIIVHLTAILNGYEAAWVEEKLTKPPCASIANSEEDAACTLKTDLWINKGTI